MKRSLFAVAILISLTAASAAQQPPDPKLEAYKFLLSEANERVVQANAQVSALTAEIAQLKAQAKKAEDEAAKAKK